MRGLRFSMARSLAFTWTLTPQFRGGSFSKLREATLDSALVNARLEMSSPFCLGERFRISFVLDGA